MVAIEVSEYVKEKLDEIKQKYQHKSYDSVIRELLYVYENRKTETKDTFKRFIAEEFARVMRIKLTEGRYADVEKILKIAKEVGIIEDKGGDN